MKEIKKITKEIVFKKKIIEVSSISLDDSYEYLSDKVLGEFIVSGIVKQHDFGDVKDEFNESFEIEYDCKDNIKNVLIEVTDFTYDIEDNRIKLDIEYTVNYDEIESVIEEPKEIEKLLDDDNFEIIDFRDEEIPETTKKETVELEPERELVEDDYIMYHVYVVLNNDSFESLSSKFNISIEDIKEYNDIKELKAGMKLIIPCSNE